VSRPLRIATRGSKLALWQAEHVAVKLLRLHPGITTTIVEIRTSGDDRTDVPLASISNPAFFTGEIENALLAGQADAAVHSLKDLASVDVPGLELGAVLRREDARDALVTREGRTLHTLDAKARLGTSSVRRRALVSSIRPDLEVLDLRGNVPTRLAKLDAGEYDAIILATAGLVRLGLGDRISERLDLGHFMPAAGQGAIAVQVRVSDAESAALVAPLQHSETRAAVDAERAFLAGLQVGCQAPVGVHARVVDGQLDLHASVLAFDGTKRLDVRTAGPLSDAVEIGQRLATEVRAKGGADLIEAARGAARL